MWKVVNFFMVALGAYFVFMWIKDLVL